MKALIFASFLAVSVALPVMAQESPSPYAVPRAVRQIQERVKEGVQNLRPANATREELEARKQELRTAAEEKREELKARVDEARARAKEEIEARKAELKERLQQVRDEQKKKIVERIEKQLNELNERLTRHFSEVLDRLEKTLVNIESRIDKAESRGLNVSSVRALVVSAREAIVQARAAIEGQAAKNYVPDITGEEEKLKVEVGQARQALHNDLKTLREKIRLAFEAVRRVAAALAQIPRVDEEPTVSPTPTVTPTPSESPSPSPTQ